MDRNLTINYEGVLGGNRIIMVQTPAWRVEPEQVWISCQEVKTVEPNRELLVQFVADGASYVALVPERFVNQANKSLQGFIIADCERDLLVQLPVETFTSGSRILVRDAERRDVLMYNG